MKRMVWPVGFFVFLLFFWHLTTSFFQIPKYLFPGPLDVAFEAIKNYDLIFRHAKITAGEVLAGLSLGVFLGYFIAVIIVSSKTVEAVIYPYIIGSQTIPKIAIAPLLLIWFGYGILPKIVVSALVCFFPIVISVTRGLKEIDPDLIDVLKTCRASKWQTLIKIRIPGAVPSFFVGLKTATPLSIIGAVVGEFVGSDLGLGYLILYSQSNFNMPLAFAAILVLSLIGIIIFSLIALAEIVFFKKAYN